MVEQILTCSLGKTPHWSRGKPKGGYDLVGILHLVQVCTLLGILERVSFPLSCGTTPQDSWGGDWAGEMGENIFPFLVKLFLVQNQGV